MRVDNVGIIKRFKLDENDLDISFEKKHWLREKIVDGKEVKEHPFSETPLRIIKFFLKNLSVKKNERQDVCYLHEYVTNKGGLLYIKDFYFSKSCVLMREFLDDSGLPNEDLKPIKRIIYNTKYHKKYNDLIIENATYYKTNKTTS